QYTEQDQRSRHGRLGARARHLFPVAVGFAFHADSCIWRPRRKAASRRIACCEARQGAFRVHGARLLPGAACGRAGRLPPLRHSGLRGQMTHHDDNRASAPDSGEGELEALDEATGLPWPRSWRGVYAFVLVCLALWVTMLVVLERSFS